MVNLVLIRIIMNILRWEDNMLDKIVIVCSGILIGGFVFMYVVGG
jgi:hypothetical protein